MLVGVKSQQCVGSGLAPDPQSGALPPAPETPLVTLWEGRSSGTCKGPREPGCGNKERDGKRKRLIIGMAAHDAVSPFANPVEDPVFYGNILHREAHAKSPIDLLLNY